MKHCIIFLFLLPFMSYGQDSVFVIKNTVEVENANQKELYSRCLIWLAKNFESSLYVIQLKDEEEGRIICKGSIAYEAPAFSVGTYYSGYFKFTLTFECKDGRYRYLIDMIEHESTTAGYSVGDIGTPYVKNRLTNVSVKKIIAKGKEEMYSFEKRLLKGMAIAPSKDW